MVLTVAAVLGTTSATWAVPVAICGIAVVAAVGAPAVDTICSNVG